MLGQLDHLDYQAELFVFVGPRQGPLKMTVYEAEGSLEAVQSLKRGHIRQSLAQGDQCRISEVMHLFVINDLIF